MSVGVLLPPPEVGGGFAEGARRAVARVLAAGYELDVRTGWNTEVDPSWDAVLCHGVQYRDRLVQRRPGLRAVLTDRPADTTGLDGVVLVDWCWAEAAYEAGRYAAQTAAGRPIGLVAGPAVRTQRRFAEAFSAGAQENGHPDLIATIHTSTFDDRAGGARAGQILAGDLGCAVVAHSADSAGETGCAAARRAGAATIGFVEPLGEHIATVDSDVEGVLEHLLRALVTGARLPEVYGCGLGTGHLALVTGPGR